MTALIAGGRSVPVVTGRLAPDLKSTHYLSSYSPTKNKRPIGNVVSLHLALWAYKIEDGSMVQINYKLAAFWPIAAILILVLATPLHAGQIKVTLSQAILNTLDSNLGIKIQKEEIRKSEGLHQKASGEFDWAAFNGLSYQRNVALPTIDRAFESGARENLGTYTMGVKKKLRSGISIAPALEAYYYDNNRSQTDGAYYGIMGLEVVIPLMRGLGREATQALENASRLKLKATQHMARYQIAQQIHDTANSYWNCLFESKKIGILSEIKANSKIRLEQLKRLVKLGEADRVLIEQAENAYLANQAGLISEQLSLFRSKQALMLAMGRSDMTHIKALIPEGVFPQIPASDIFAPTITKKDLQPIIDNRGDYKAATIAVDAEKILLKRAQNELKPQLDMKFQAGYPNLSAGLKLVYPLGNNGAKGEVLQKRSQVNQAKLRQAVLSEQIALQVRVTVEALRGLIAQNRLAAKSVKSHLEQLDIIKQKITAGEKSSRELVDAKERYLQALIKKNRLQQQYALALADLSHVSGKLLAMDQNSYRFNLDTLLKVPELKGITKKDAHTLNPAVHISE